jgi:subtilisin-like proprotein convertase family protein
MNKFVAFSAVAGAAIIASAASADVSTFGGPFAAIMIPDSPAPGISVDVVVATGGAINDINVTMVLTHTWFGDLDISLTKLTGAGAGTSVIFSNGTPDDSSNLLGLYTMDDEAATTWDAAATAAGTTIAAGSYRPDGLLSSFDGLDMAGTWRLSIVDTFAADIGSINHLSLTIDYVPAPAGLAVLALAGLGRRRRA